MENQNNRFTGTKNIFLNKSSLLQLWMDNDIANYIKRFKTTEGYYTHVSLLDPRGKYIIERSDIENFWNFYCNKICYNPGTISGIAECLDYESPVVGDIDLEVLNSENKNENLYTTEDVKNIILIYHSVLVECIKDIKSKHLICFLLEKPFYIKDNYYKNGFHLHFFNCYLNNATLKLITSKVNDIFLKGKIFSNIDNRNKIIDVAVTRNSWLLYGSSKNTSGNTYRVTKIFNSHLEEITLEEAINKSKFKLYNIDEEEIKLDKSLDYYLPRILSVKSHKKVILKCNPACEQDIKSRKEPIKRINDFKYDELSLSQLLLESKQLLKFISNDRLNNHNQWIDLGWTLYCIGNGSEEFRDLWVEKCSYREDGHYDEDRCIYEWNRMENKGRTIGTLKHYAKIDSPIEYIEYSEKRYKEHITDYLKGGGDNDLAKALHEKNNNGDIFVCVGLKKDIWYKFENHKWDFNECAIDLRKFISKELLEYVKKSRNVEHNKILEKNQKSEDGDNQDDQDNKVTVELKDMYKKYSKIMANLKDANKKDRIIKECREVFYRKGFDTKLDSNPYLIGFENGVYDLSKGTFRDGTPDDYVSLSTGYDFKEFTIESPEVIDVEEYLNKVFPDSELNQYFKEYCAGILQGKNINKEVLVWSGGARGSNAKSVTIELLELTLGKYAIKFPTSLITGRRTQSSQAVPELERAKGVRFAVLQEPGKKDPINVGVLKELTGNDSMYTRGLFKEGCELKPQFNLSLICNHLPQLPDDEPAAWERIRVLSFESRFLHKKDCPETKQEQYEKKIFPKDKNFSEKLPGMKQAFMWILIENYKRIKKDGRMNEPEKVIEATTKYKNDNNIFLKFVHDCIISDANGYITNIDVYSLFREWFRNSFSFRVVPNKDELIEDLLTRWGPYNKGRGWIGYRYRTLKDDEREGKVITIDLDEEINQDINKSDAPV